MIADNDFDGLDNVAREVADIKKKNNNHVDQQ